MATEASRAIMHAAHVVGVKVERRFDFIDGFAVKVLFHARQVSSDMIFVHRFLIRMPVITNAQLL